MAAEVAETDVVEMYARWCRISHGEAEVLYKTVDGKKKPSGKRTKKLDFLRLARPAADGLTYVTYTPLQKLLQDYAGGSKPMYCPVCPISDEVWPHFRATFSARGKSKGEGCPVPMCERVLTEDDIAPCARRHEVAPGSAVCMRPDSKNPKRLVAESRNCLVAECPDFERPATDIGGAKLRCTFGYDLRVYLPFEQAELYPLPAFYHSSSWRSFKYFWTSLRQIRRKAGLLEGLPHLRIVLFREMGAQYTQFRCNIVFPGNEMQLKQAAMLVRQERAQLDEGDEVAALPEPEKPLALLDGLAADPAEQQRRALEFGGDDDMGDIDDDAAPAVAEEDAPPAEAPVPATPVEEGGVTEPELRAHAKREKVPQDALQHIVTVADQAHPTEGVARNEFIMDQLVTWAKQRDAGEAQQKDLFEDE